MRRQGRGRERYRGYGNEFERRTGRGYWRAAGRRPGAPPPPGYGFEYRTAFRDRNGYGRVPRDRPRGAGSETFWPPPPRRPARGFPAHAVHTYDLDYGRQAGGPTTEYSGRAGYPVPQERAAGWAGYSFPEEWRRGRRRAMARRRPRQPPRHWSTAEPPRLSGGYSYGW